MYDPYKGKEAVNKNCLLTYQMLDLLDKDIEWVIPNMFKELKKNISDVLKQSMRTVFIKYWVLIKWCKSFKKIEIPGWKLQ